jgi:hypothetical protein
MRILKITPFLVFLLLLVVLALPSPVFAQGPDGDKIVWGGNYELLDNEVLNGDLIIFGGTARLEQGSLVNGQVILFGGSLEVDGTILGSITAIGGSVRLGDTSVINGDVNTVGTSFKKADGAVIRGNTSFQLPGRINIPEILPFLSGLLPENTPDTPEINGILTPIRDLFWGLFQALAIAVLAVISALFFEKPIARMGHMISRQPIKSGSIGLLTAIVAPGILIILMITIILIPLGLLGIIILGMAYIAGWIATGYEIGSRLSSSIHQTWATPVSAGLGTLLLTLMARGIGEINCVGWIPGALIGILGLGGVILSRFGMYPSKSEEPAIS